MKKLVRNLYTFFAYCTKQEFIDIFGDHIGNHLYSKHKLNIEKQGKMTLDDLDQFISNLDADALGKMENYILDIVGN